MVEILLAFFDEAHLARMLEAATTAEDKKVIATELQKVQFALKASNLAGPTLLERLGIDLKSDGLLRNPLFNVWCKFVGTKKGWSMYKVTIYILLARYDESNIARALSAAMETDSLAWKLQYALLWYWKNRGVPVEHVFKLLVRIPASGDLLGELPPLNLWYKYVKMMEGNSNEVVTKFLPTSLPRIDQAKMLEVASKVDNTKNIALWLQKKQMSAWQSDNVEPETLFEQLAIKPAHYDLPLLNVWFKYLEIRKYSDTKVVQFLSSHYEEIDITKMLEAATWVDDMEPMATKLQAVQLDTWDRDGLREYTLLERLGLDLKSDDLLGNPLLYVWCKFVGRGKKLDWNWKEKRLAIRVLLTCYKEIDLARMLEEAQKVKSTNTIATTYLQKMQLDEWEKEKLPFPDLFKRLGLDPIKDDFFMASPLFNVWYKYVQRDNFDRVNERVVKFFLKNYFGDASLAKRLEVATKIESTKEIATELQKEQLKRWLNDLNDIWDELGLSPDKLPGNPLFNVWCKFMMKSCRNDRSKVVQSLSSRVGEYEAARILEDATKAASTKEIATELQDEQFELWLQNGLNDIWDGLGLDPDKLPGNPLFNVWCKFMMKSCRNDRSKVVQSLSSRVGEYEAARILEDATKAASTEETATELQEEQLQGWKSQPLEVDALFQQLELGKTRDNLIGNPLFRVWFKYANVVWASVPDPDIMAVDFLTSRVGRSHLVDMVNDASEVDDANVLAFRLRLALFRAWKRDKHL